MLLELVAAAAIASAGPPLEWTRSVPVANGTVQRAATYVARPLVKTRQIGMSAGTRMSSERCLWTASIAVARRLDAEAARGRDLPVTKTLQGSHLGGCIANRRNIARGIAHHSPAIDAHLAAVAEQDQRELRSEIEALTPPTGR